MTKEQAVEFFSTCNYARYSLEDFFNQGVKCILHYALQFKNNEIKSTNLLRFATDKDTWVNVRSDGIFPACEVYVAYFGDDVYVADTDNSEGVNGVGETVELAIADLVNNLQNIFTITNEAMVCDDGEVHYVTDMKPINER